MQSLAIETAPRRRCGFTLIELLVVVAIIALLISILLPSLSRAKASARDSVCASNLHQLGMATHFYLDDFNDILPFMLGSPDAEGEPTNPPFYQYHQIFNFWDYLKDLDIFVCPSAREQTSVKRYYAEDTPYASYYTVLKADDRYLRAYRDGWWPGINPTDYPGPRVPPLHTEYWYNDWGRGATWRGKEIPPISGGAIAKIPLPMYTVIMCDGVWEGQVLRHANGTSSQFVFLDGHVDKFKRLHYYDEREPSPDITFQDYDAFGNKPFWVWGLTREGYNCLDPN